MFGQFSHPSLLTMGFNNAHFPCVVLRKYSFEAFLSDLSIHWSLFVLDVSPLECSYTIFFFTDNLEFTQPV